MARAGRVRRPNLEIAATVAETLGVSLNDLFAVETVPTDAEIERDVDEWSDEDDDAIDPEQSDRLSDLFDLQDRRTLTDAERAEMRALVAEWARQVNEQSLHSIAEKRSLPVEQVRIDVAADFDRIVAWHRELEADPARLESLVQESWEQQRARVRR